VIGDFGKLAESLVTAIWRFQQAGIRAWFEKHPDDPLAPAAPKALGVAARQKRRKSGSGRRSNADGLKTGACIAPAITAADKLLSTRRTSHVDPQHFRNTRDDGRRPMPDDRQASARR